MSRCAIPPVFIRTPVRMKNGTASSEKLSTPETIFWHATKVDRSSGRAAETVTREETIRLIETGTLNASIRKKLASRSRPICTTDILDALLSYLAAVCGSSRIALISSKMKMMA